MVQKINFNKLLEDLFQDPVPIRKNVQGQQAKITQTEENKDMDSSLQACNLYVFMREIVMEKFGMSYDYAFRDKEGTPLKSWFTIADVIEAAKSQGYKLTVTDCKTYLDKLIKERYIETDDYKYRRCAFWDKRMENYLRQCQK